MRDRPNPGVLQCAYCSRWFCYAHLTDKSHDCAEKQVAVARKPLKA